MGKYADFVKSRFQFLIAYGALYKYFARLFQNQRSNKEVSCKNENVKTGIELEGSSEIFGNNG